MSNVDLLREAAAKMRERATAATPSPWRDSSVDGNRYAALVSDTMPAGRNPGGGWDETEHYGGYLIAESVQPQDRQHIASWSPTVAFPVADWLDFEAGFYAAAGPPSPTFNYAVAVATAYLTGAE
jgi:hypothetical protein